MDSSISIRAQIDADAHLQVEINRGLMTIAETLSQGSDRRVVRILARTLGPSWTEHVSFQDEVLFPILIAHHAREVGNTVARLRSEHPTLSLYHTAVGELLDRLLAGRPADTGESERLLRNTFEQRRMHLKAEAALERWLPVTLSGAEVLLCTKWMMMRPRPRFPLNLLRGSGRAFRPAGGWSH